MTVETEEISCEFTNNLNAYQLLSPDLIKCFSFGFSKKFESKGLCCMKLCPLCLKDL